LADNDTAFRSRAFAEFAKKWGAHVRFRCAHAPSGNGITERAHRTVKRIAARKQCSVQEAVYWHNMSPKDGQDASSAPANRIFRYKWRVLGLDAAPATETCEADNGFRVGDSVWVRPENNRCTTRYERGRVTKIVSEQAVEVNGFPRHVRDVRLASAVDDHVEFIDPPSVSGDEHNFDPALWDRRSESGDESESEETGPEEEGPPFARRSTRDTSLPDWYGVQLDRGAL